MGIYRSEIADLRKSLEDNIGKKIIVKESPGKRSKPQEKVATIENTYAKYFRVKFEEANRVGSYNYTDLFTKSIEVRFCDGEPFAPVLQNHVEAKRHTKPSTVAPVENAAAPATTAVATMADSAPAEVTTQNTDTITIENS